MLAPVGPASAEIPEIHVVGGSIFPSSSIFATRGRRDSWAETGQSGVLLADT